MTTTTSKLTRNRNLDALRAVAILLVFVRHTNMPIPIFGMIGWIGVDLFFVLSGFLVSGLLFSEYKKHGTIQPGRFLIRRGFKIYPQFYALIAISLGCSYFWPTLLPHPPVWNFVREMLFVQNYAPGLWWSHTWSLAIEEHFYIILAFVITPIAKRGSIRLLPPGIIALCVLILILRIATWMWNPDMNSTYVHYSPTHLRVDSLLIGVLVSYYYSFHAEKLAAIVKKYDSWISPVSLACLFPVFFQASWTWGTAFLDTIGFSLIAIGFALLLLMVVHSESSSTAAGPVVRSIAWMGRSSYAFYLAHVPVLFWADQLFNASFPAAVKIGIAFAATIVVASLSTSLIELPCLKLRDRLFPSNERGKATLLVPEEIESSCHI